MKKKLETAALNFEVTLVHANAAIAGSSSSIVIVLEMSKKTRLVELQYFRVEKTCKHSTH